MLSALQFSIFLLCSFVEDFVVVSFQEKNEIKKEKYSDRVQIFTFSFENRFVWHQRFLKEIWQMIIWSENVFKRNLMLQFSGERNFARETFLGGQHMLSSSTKTPKRINFKLCTHISKRLLHKTVPAFFLIMSHLFFIAIIQGVLKAYFAWKQLKVDYSKHTWKKEDHGMVFSLATYQWQKII